MAGIKYIKNTEVMDLTSSDCNGITNHALLYVLKGSETNDKIK